LRAFDQSPRYWLNLQQAYDLRMAEPALAKRLKSLAVVTGS
jgi:plasmid maintenance system antidote protein VapI